MESQRATLSLSNRKRLSYLGTATGACVLGLIAAYLSGGVLDAHIDGQRYLVFHLMAEFASIVVSFAIFTIGWYGYKQRSDTRNLALAITFFTVGILDFIHTLSFQGMPDLISTNSVSKAATYWIAARLVAAVGLLLVPLIPEKAPPGWLRPRLLALASLGLVALLVVMLNYTDLVPAMFEEGVGLTRLKTGLEYLVITLNLATIVVLWKRPVFGIRATTLLQSALVITVFTELAFTLYASADDSYNFLGHIFKAVAYYLILRAIFVSSLQQPYLELSQAREDLQRSFDSIGMALSSSLDLNKTLDLIVRLASDLLHSPALVALQQREPDSLTVLATHGVSDAPQTIALKDNLASKVWHDRAPVWIDEVDALSQAYPSIMQGGVFRSALAAPILKDGSILGEIAVYSRSPAAFKEPEARLLTAFARQAAVAIENARLYQSELESRTQIQNYVSQLSVLHNISLSLNRETDQGRLLRMVLKNAAQLTGAGAGIMTLIREGKTEVISEYYAPWYEDRCNIDERASTLHQRVERLAQGDATRIADTSGLEMLPVGHISLRGLLVGTLRDTRGRTLGHFMLSEKSGGGEFTSEDEELIALLAAQSSVALVSAESFGREHRVAETLQAALLPAVPERDDVEVGLLYRSAGSYGKVGGDFYDFIELGGSRIAVVVGDVCGKGLEAATYTAMIKYMLRAYLGEGMLAGDCLTRLNRAAHDQVPLEKFITVGLAVIDTSTQVISYSSAGHPHPCICHDGKSTIMQTTQAVPLGVLPDTRYLTTQISAEEACSIFMYSDGLIEARPADGEPFGEARLTEVLGGRCCDQAQQVANDVLQAAVDYSGGELRDDIALVAVRLIKEQGPGHS
ncbi:MAG: SpoIIE family protein phosphatase [Actinobacteria bacterium]|nr:SpoIIE family protein phosphatase [Actinomycetota bacterium]